ncbi:MAG: thiamine ABC transporter substrate-binding protein [Nitriliruptoraceae bacterium]
MTTQRWVAALAIVSMAIAACGDASDDATDSEPTTVRVLTHDSFDVDADLVAAYEHAHNLRIEFIAMGDAGSVVNQAILTRNAPQGDVLFGVDTTFLSRAIDAELFVSYRSPRLDAIDTRYLVDDEYRVTPIDVGDVCLNVDVGWFDDAGLPLPTDLDDLTDDAYRGLTAVMNPATSSPGLAFLLATVDRFGQDGWLDFWASLRANDVVVTDGWSETYYDEFTLHGGDRPIVVSYASSPPAEVFFADPQPDVAPSAVIEASCFRQVEFAGILAGTEVEEAAGSVIDFLLSVKFQEGVPLTMFVFPVVNDAQLPDVFARHAVVPDSPLELDPWVIGEHRDQWINDWTSTVLR